jgi:hypothetical protein
MTSVVLAILCALPAVTHQLKFSLRSNEKQEIASEALARHTFASAVSLLQDLETDLSHISKVLGAPTHVASLMQLESAPASSAAPKAHKKGIDAAAAVKQMAKLKPEQMPAMLGLITGMYDSWKDKIGEANKHEQEQKKAFEKTVSDLEAKKAMYKDSKDAIATYDRIETYWKRQRSIAHRQYHTALKIMHSGMQKFKSVSAAMQHAIAGKKPTAKDLQTVGMAMPDVVLLQTWTKTASQEISHAKLLSNA